jgi:DHA1 family bicyclomycin/chloramphenicol resistance-like MFS transporter
MGPDRGSGPAAAPAQAASAAPPRLTPLLAGLAILAPFSIDTYLPSFPAIADALGASRLEVQQTLTAYLVPYAFMMLWHGTLSDALGRRRVILASLVVYTVASVACAGATRIEHLWLARAVQGLSAGAGMVVGRAMVRDLMEGPAAQRLFAQVGMMFALGPAVAPIVGGWIHAGSGWRAVFLFLALYGALLLLASLVWLPETLPPESRRRLHPVHLARAYGTVFGQPLFLLLAAALALNFNGFFLYVMSAPVFLMEHLALPPTGFGWLFIPSVSGVLVGSWLSGRMAGKVSPQGTVALGFALMGAGAALNLAANLLLPPGLPQSVLPIGVYNTGMALAMPALSLLVLDLFPHNRGTASSCQSFVQMGINALSAALLAPLLWASTLGLAAGMAAFLAAGGVAYGTYLRAIRP